ncbi:MAG TPA: hypothetical protein VMS45_06670 [Gemmatimonadaceae bacterium]|jgi:hypothetical protein|nr:hypothetical protein [Gemmatimonadaceae bacterium]
MRIQLLTFPECENAAPARELLTRVLATCGMGHAFEEIDTQAAGTPEPYRSYASPTILVDGVPVGGGDPRSGTWGACCCRLYVDEDGRLSGLPSEAAILSALARASSAPGAALSP